MSGIFGDPGRFVADSVAGFALAHPSLVVVNSEPLYVTRFEATLPGTVALLSGGGSGHEPLHLGFVGEGMLDAAVPGPVFTSPAPDAIVAAAKAVDAGAGVLFIVKNYTGDVLNFETAAEFAGLDGITVRTVLVADDVSLADAPHTAGRRGVAGTVVVEKILGAAARRGDELEQLVTLGEKVAGSVKSIGVALRAPVNPVTGVASFDLAEGELEFGIGIHGEPGRARMPLKPLGELVADMLAAILDDGAAQAGDRVLLLVNGMGGTPQAQLHLVLQTAALQLEEQEIRVVRPLAGDFVTALDMQGFSLTVFALDDETEALWDAPVTTATLQW